MAENKRVLLDSSALLDWFDDKPSADLVESNIEHAAVSALTLSILATKIGARTEPHESTRLLNLGIYIIDVDETIALEVARVSFVTIAHNLTTEDLVVLATGRVHQLSVVSGSDSLIGIKLDRPEVTTLRRSKKLARRHA